MNISHRYWKSPRSARKVAYVAFTGVIEEYSDIRAAFGRLANRTLHSATDPRYSDTVLLLSGSSPERPSLSVSFRYLFSRYNSSSKLAFACAWTSFVFSICASSLSQIDCLNDIYYCTSTRRLSSTSDDFFAVTRHFCSPRSTTASLRHNHYTDVLLFHNCRPFV